MSRSERVAVPASFVSDFETVCTRYGLTEQERKEAKEAARRDLDNAIVCFAAIAKEEN